MSLVPVAAELIRRATADEGYAIDLELALDDRQTRRGLLQSPIDKRELGVLAPTEWLWFLEWRQEHGGALDSVLLDWLARANHSRSFRFQLRGIVFRDPRTNRTLEREAPDSVGLAWLRRQRQADNPLELALDALQHGTPAAEWLLNLLMHDERYGGEVRDMVQSFARSRFTD